MILDPSGRAIHSDPTKQELSDAFFRLNRDLTASIFGFWPGTILDERGQPMNRPGADRAFSGSGLAAWIPDATGAP